MLLAHITRNDIKSYIIPMDLKKTIIYTTYLYNLNVSNKYNQIYNMFIKTCRLLYQRISSCIFIKRKS